MVMSEIYDADFYARNLKFQRALAPYLSHFIARNLKPGSVIDFGCGCGYLLAIIGQACGCDIMGLNGDKPDNLQIPAPVFQVANFLNSVDVRKKFDLVLSLEVAEHLPASYADIFICDLVRHAEKYVIFSAATPGQGGVGHINEQPHEYWHKQFLKHGFEMRDEIRPILMGHKDIPFWYRRNIFLYERISS
jgi:SAM-dependent methyltransferase